MRRALCILSMFLGANGVCAQPLVHPWSVVDNGNGVSASPSILLHSSAGQPATARMTVAPSVLSCGYLPGLQQFRSQYVHATVAVRPGWNLVSLPLLAADPRVDSVFPSATSMAFRYVPGSGHDTAGLLTFGSGYWLKFGGTENIDLMGFRRLEDSLDVTAGWNLIGSVSGPVAVGDIQQDPPGIVVSQFYTFGATGYTPAEVIEPGKGVWVKAAGPGMLLLSAPPEWKRSVPRAAERGGVKAVRQQ